MRAAVNAGAGFAREARPARRRGRDPAAARRPRRVPAMKRIWSRSATSRGSRRAARIELDRDTLVTPAARDLAFVRGITLVEPRLRRTRGVGKDLLRRAARRESRARRRAGRRSPTATWLVEVRGGRGARAPDRVTPPAAQPHARGRRSVGSAAPDHEGARLLGQISGQVAEPDDDFPISGRPRGDAGFPRRRSLVARPRGRSRRVRRS